MRFGKTLRNSVYAPWKDKYLEYGKLKALLREDSDDDRPWTEQDEQKFCEEILNVQLEKVAAFQASTFKSLEERANKAGEKLRELSPDDGKAKSKGDITNARFKEIEDELDAIINETKELKKYSNLNYTGFLKIVKKHDRKRGNNYKVRPMMQMSLSKRPFNTEHKYSPLLNKLSMMYFIVRQQLDENIEGTAISSEAQAEVQNGERYTAYKCKENHTMEHTHTNLEQSGFILTISSRSRHTFSADYQPSYTLNNPQKASRPRAIPPSILSTSIIQTSLCITRRWNVRLTLLRFALGGTAN